MSSGYLVADNPKDISVIRKNDTLEFVMCRWAIVRENCLIFDSKGKKHVFPLANVDEFIIG